MKSVLSRQCFQGFQLELAEFIALQDRPCIFLLTLTYSLILIPGRSMVGKSEYCFEVSSDIDQTSFGWTARKFYKGKDVFSCSQEAEWKPPSLLEKFHCKAEGSPDAVGQRLP